MATDYQWTVSFKNKTTNVATPGTSVTYTGGDYEDSGIWKVTTTEISHTISTDLANVAGLYIENLDSANFVEFGYATATYDHKLAAGTVWLVPLVPAASTIYLKADTATCNVVYRFFEAP